jgi:hypothetical protein
MHTLDILPGFDLAQLEKVLAATDDIWDSLRLAGLQSTDAFWARSGLIPFLKKFGHRKSQKQRWKSLVASWLVPPSHELIELLIEIIQLDVFQSVHFKCPSEFTPAIPAAGPDRNKLPLPILRACLDGRNAAILQHLTLSNVNLDQQTASLLLEMVGGTDNSTSLKGLAFFTCKFDGRSFHTICEGIQKLRRLETLKLWHNCLGYQDQIVLWYSVKDHPSLTRFDWMERNAVSFAASNDPSDDAIPSKRSMIVAAVLGSPHCKIRVLGLSLGSIGTVASILSHVCDNESIEWLDMSYNGCYSPTANTGHDKRIEDEQSIFRNLHTLRRLRYLDLFNTYISASAFEALVEYPAPSLERISCDLWAGSADCHVETVFRILATHPTFIEFHGGLHLKQRNLEFLMDTRKILPTPNRGVNPFDGTKFHPASLWPLVLERPNRLLPPGTRQSQAMYWLIDQGPAFSALPLS